MKYNQLKAFLLPSMLIWLLSCSNGDRNVIFKINMRNVPSKQLAYLDLIEMDGEPVTMDSLSVSSGVVGFELKGGAQDPSALYRVRFEKSPVFFLLVPDQKEVSLVADWQQIDSYTSNSSGTQSFKALVYGFSGRLQAIDSLRNLILSRGEVMDSSRVVLETSFRDKAAETGNYLLAYADSTATPAIALYALGMSKNLVAPEQVLPVLDGVAKRFDGFPKVKKLAEAFNQGMNRASSENLVGKPAPVFELPGVDGTPYSLKSLRGTYVLIDFWASWCRPCRMENPNVVEAFQKYKTKNFTVLGVSLDKTKADWVKAIKEDRLEWKHVSDLQFWNSQVVPMYGIEGIPFNVLIDTAGVVIAKDLRGEELQTKLAEVLK